MARGLSVYVDTRDFKKLHDHLERFRKRAIPYAARDALNGCAFELRKAWQSEIRTTFTNRNKFTERSIRVEKASGVDLKTMQSRTGSVAAYMGDQEGGGTVKGRGKHKAIPSPAAGGGRAGGTSRPKLVSGRYRHGSITVKSPSLAKYGRRRQNAIVLAIAIRKHERFALLNRSKGKGRGIFEVKGLKRKAKTKLIWNVSKGSVKVKPEPTMQRAISASGWRFEKAIYNALLTQLKRNRLMGF
jgi:hypothetical protein